MRTPAQSKTFFRVTEKLNLWIDGSCWRTRMLRSVPDHDSPIRAHSGYYIRVLWLISSFVDLPFVVDLLDNIELHFHHR